MWSTTLISVDEYLHTSYSPDCEYVDGEVLARNLGEKDHAAVQGALLLWFSQFRKQWNVRVYPELRVQVAPTRFRVPDICLISRDAPNEQIITHPPLVCIEVLSPDDRITRMIGKIGDYREFGVKNIWIIDPATQRGYNCKPTGLFDAVEFVVEDSPIRLSLPQLFADLD